MNKWDAIEYNGQKGEILAIDSDPRANVMIKLYSDPDRTLFVPRSELTIAS